MFCIHRKKAELTAEIVVVAEIVAVSHRQAHTSGRCHVFISTREIHIRQNVLLTFR